MEKKTIENRVSKMEEKINEEREQKAGRLSAIVDALKEVEYLVNSVRHGHRLTDDELLTAQERISDPLYLYYAVISET